MHRRSYLASIAACSSLGAGCLEDDEPSTEPTVSQQPLSAYTCPPEGTRQASRAARRTVCSHTLDTDSTSVYLRPSVEETSNPLADLSVTLTNESAEPLEFNPTEWTLYSYGSDRWSPVEDTEPPGFAVTTVPPGQTKTWAASAIGEWIKRDGYGFPPSTYAAAIRVPDPHSHDAIRCVSVFRVTRTN